MILDCILIAAIAVFVVDLSGWTDWWKGELARWLVRQRGEGARLRSLPPFDCSLCVAWWCCLVWCWVRYGFSLEMIAACAAAAYLTTTLYKTLTLAKGTLDALLDWLADTIEGIFYRRTRN